MKKKEYIEPKMKVVELDSTAILTIGSDTPDFNKDKGTQGVTDDIEERDVTFE